LAENQDSQQIEILLDSVFTPSWYE